MGLRPASPGRRGHPQLHMLGDKHGESARRVQGTPGGKNCKHPHFTEGVQNVPLPLPQSKTAPRPGPQWGQARGRSGFKPLLQLTRHPGSCFLHKIPPEPAECGVLTGTHGRGSQILPPDRQRTPEAGTLCPAAQRQGLLGTEPHTRTEP